MIVYRIIIQAIEYLIEILYTLLYRFLGSPGLGLIALSVAVSFLVLPLYLRSDAIAEEESARQQQMKPWLKHIRASFKGDERMMIQNRYYKSVGYRPVYALRGTLSLLLQIPFFFAAYHFLSNLELLRGCSFGPIQDLGAADGLLGDGINLLPIVMTLINILSAFVYSKGKPLKEKLQPIVLAALFLLILYQSPAGLVVYWTMNNVFSLCKNLVMKFIKNRKRFVSLVLLALDLLFVSYLFASGKLSYRMSIGDHEWILYMGLLAFALLLPLLIHLPPFAKYRKAGEHSVAIEGKKLWRLILIEESSLALLAGAVIPLSVIHTSPEDFVNFFHYLDPLYFVYTSLCVAVGLYLFWGSVVAWMLKERGRYIYALILFILLLGTLLTFYGFKPPNVDTLNAYLQWDGSWPRYELRSRVFNLALWLGAALIAILFMKRFIRLSQRMVSLIFAALFVICLWQAADSECLLAEAKPDNYELIQNERREFTLSRNETNVVLLMLDRAVGAFIPFIFHQYPEIAAQFDGFTFYPNTVSFGPRTVFGTPALFGGYEYSAQAINARPAETVVDKHNEAISVLPRIFGEEAGFLVTVCDVPLAGGIGMSDFSHYQQYDYVNAFHVKSSMIGAMSYEESRQVMERNFVMFGLYKMLPLMLQDEVYDKGGYLKTDDITALVSNMNYSRYRAALEYLTEQTELQQTGEGRFIMMNSEITHDPALLQLPDYQIVREVDNSGYDTGIPSTVNGRTITEGRSGDGLTFYQVNVAALMILGDWFDRLREEGVYDNTRFIIVSDHGQNSEMFADMVLADGLDVQTFNALFLYKDFDSRGAVQTDEQFMTNADGAVLAAQGIVAQPTNPFSGHAMEWKDKEDGVELFWTSSWRNHDPMIFDTPDAVWYHLSPGDIADEKNWTRME